MTLSDIPRESLEQMLKEACWYSGGRFKKEGIEDGYSLSVAEETRYRDVLLRKAVLYPTPEEAIIGEYRKFYT